MTSLLNQRILDTLTASILCLDAQLVIGYVNSSAETLFAGSAAHLLGRKFPDLLSQVEVSTINEKLTGFVDKPTALTERGAVITLAGGKSFIADYSIYPFNDGATGNGLLVEIRQLEYQLQFAQEELSQLHHQLRQQLSRSLAHEINNPLGGIRGAAQLLEKELHSAELQEYTEVIINEVDRLQSLVNNISGPGNLLQLEAVNILEVLEHIRKIVLAAEPERIRIKRDYDPSIPELSADRNLLIQAFLNIARNAVQAIDGTGTITFKTRVGRQVTIGKKTHALVVQIDISDDGRGISRELCETIFLPMITDKAEGSGLGLPIAQEIISRHEGIIRLQAGGVGTTFCIQLPLD